MLPLVALLTDPVGGNGDPGDTFDVVIPALTGFAFSDLSADPGRPRPPAAATSSPSRNPDLLAADLRTFFRPRGN